MNFLRRWSTIPPDNPTPGQTTEEPFHVDPEQAARIAHIMGAGTAIGIHWGTFPLSEEAPTEQRRRFMAAGGTAPRIGETLILRP